MTARSAPLSANFEIFRRSVAPIFDDFVFDGLPLVQRTEARSLNRGNVHEHILAAAGRLDEPITLLSIELLHSSLGHIVVLINVPGFNAGRMPSKNTRGKRRRSWRASVPINVTLL
jgi:hypothetical protein